MVYINEFSDFQVKALDLLQRDPIHTRYVTKYRQKDNEAVIKVTNDVECWQFKIDAQNAEKAEEFVRDITFAFIKSASNRQTDDAALDGPGAAGGKKGGKKKGSK